MKTAGCALAPVGQHNKQTSMASIRPTSASQYRILEQLVCNDARRAADCELTNESAETLINNLLKRTAEKVGVVKNVDHLCKVGGC